MTSRTLLFLLVFWCFACQKQVESKDTLLSKVPQDAVGFVRINNLGNFLSELRNNSFLDKSQAIENFKGIVEKVRVLTLMKSDSESLLGIYETGKESLDFIWVVPNASDLIDIEKAPEKVVETLTYQNKTFTKYSFGENVVFETQKKDHTLFSSSQMLLENLIRSENDFSVDNTLEKLYDSASKEKSASFFLNLKNGNSFFQASENDLGKTNPFASWVGLDFTANQNTANFSGLTMVSDSTYHFINLFDRLKPLPHHTPDYAPLNSKAIVSFTFDDYSTFAQNQNSYLDRISAQDTLFNTIEEVGVVYLKNQKLVILNSYGSESLNEYIRSNTQSAFTYQGTDVAQLGEIEFVEKAFTPLVENFKARFCANLENAFIFSETKEPIQTLLSSYKSGSTFINSQLHKTSSSTFANESNILFIADKEGLEIIRKEKNHIPFIQGFEKTDLKGYTFATQFVADEGFAHANYLISKTDAPSKNNSVSPLFTLELDSDLAIDPQFVKNHRTKRQEVVVQDVDNNLYLISSEGKVLWKKQLEGKVQGKIQQVDIYKNGRLQLAFCTNNQFFIIDRNGDVVLPFNKKFEGGNLNPLAVFDYEGNRDYRFVVTQGKNVFMYNNKAEIVDGFTFKEAESDILSAPKHFRISNKDYLTFRLANNELKILHRVGRERIKLNQKINFSENEVFLYKNKFSITNKNGQLVQVDAKGNITSTNFNLGEDHGMFATSKTLVFMDDNILSIKGKKVELDLGVYTAPQIFYIYDKIYVSVTDIQNQKIYLFDSQAKSIPNFPVYGNSMMDLIDMDNDRKLELVAKDQENSLIVYKMN